MTLIKPLIFAGFSLAVGLVLGNELRRRRDAEDPIGNSNTPEDPCLSASSGKSAAF